MTVSEDLGPGTFSSLEDSAAAVDSTVDSSAGDHRGPSLHINHPSGNAKRHAKRRKLRREAISLRGHVPTESTSRNVVELSLLVRTGLATEDLASARGAYGARPEPFSSDAHHLYSLEELVDGMGFDLEQWDGM